MAHGSGPRAFLAPLAVLVLTLLAFTPVVRNGFVDWDDFQCVSENPHIRSFSGENLHWMATTGHMAQWQPLGWFLIAAQYAFFADNMAAFARGLHGVSLALHAGIAVLAFFLLRRLTRLARAAASAVTDSAPGIDAACAIGALFFSLHPMRVEVVAWATGQPYLWAALGCLGCLWFTLNAVETGRARDRALAIACFALSLLCKPIGVPLPFVLLLLDAYPLRRFARAASGDARAIWIEKIPYVLLSVIVMIVTPLVKSSLGSSLPLSAHGLGSRLLQAARGFWFYPWKTLVPASFSPIYELHPPLRLLDFAYLGALAACAALALFWLWRGRRSAFFTVTLLAYALLIFPLLGFFQSGNQETADRYAYLPALTFSFPVSAGLAALLARRPAWRARSLAVAGIVLVGLGVLSFRLCAVWRDTASLWTHAAAVQPGSSIAQNGYAFVLLEEGRTNEAIARTREAIRIMPRNEKAHRNLWTALRAEGRTEELIAALQDAQGIFPRQADIPFFLGNAYARDRDFDRAAAGFEQALAIDPARVPALVALASVLQESGQAERAIDIARRTLDLDPRQTAARLTLARALHDSGRNDEAVRELGALLLQEPGNAMARRLYGEWRAGS
ncbi:MAG: tetratricopeptide repeat protein [Candidatus Eisenbacteria bacterium]|nr:tetratricopeptide repeat protein [Candidatus Eisenbacteria bacterium]